MLDILQEEIIDIRAYRLDIDDVVINFYKTFKDLSRKHETSHTDIKFGLNLRPPALSYFLSDHVI